MLAWVHQATASEHEFLSSLFGLKEKNRMIGSRRDEEKEEDETMVAEILDKDLEGLGRPLKVSLAIGTPPLCMCSSLISSYRCGSTRLSRVKRV